MNNKFLKLNNFFLYLIAVPIFLSFGNELIPSLNRGPTGFDETYFFATVSVGFISFLYFCILSIYRINVHAILFIILSLILGLLAYIGSGRVQAIFALQFWILMLIIPKTLKFYNYENLQKVCLNIALILLIIQVLLLYNSFSGNFSAIVPDQIKVYNYEQYYSFALIIGLYFVSIFGSSPLYAFLYYTISFMGALDSENISVTYLLVAYPIIRLVQYFIREIRFNVSFKYILLSILLISIVALPLIISFLKIFISSLYDPEMLGGRGDTFSSHFLEFEYLSLIVPKIFYSNVLRDPHNTFLTLSITVGVLPSLVLILIMMNYIKMLNIYHLFFIVPLFAISLSLTEPLQHQYTACLFSFFISVLLRLDQIKSFPLISKVALK